MGWSNEETQAPTVDSMKIDSIVPGSWKGNVTISGRYGPSFPNVSEVALYKAGGNLALHSMHASDPWQPNHRYSITKVTLLPGSKWALEFDTGAAPPSAGNYRVIVGTQGPEGGSAVYFVADVPGSVGGVLTV